VEIESAIWQPDFKVTNDFEANQLIKYYKSLSKENNRLLKGIKEEIAYLEEQAKEQEGKTKAYMGKIEALLADYVQNEVDKDDRKETPTQIKYKLTRGDFVISKASKELVKPTPEDEMVLSAEYPQFSKSELKFQWGEFKKTLEISEYGKVVEKSTGKVVESMKTVETSATFSIKLKKA